MQRCCLQYVFFHGIGIPDKSFVSLRKPPVHDVIDLAVVGLGIGPCQSPVQNGDTAERIRLHQCGGIGGIVHLVLQFGPDPDRFTQGKD